MRERIFSYKLICTMQNVHYKSSKNRITLQDCLEDWSHYAVQEGNRTVYVSSTPEEVEQMRKESFGYSACERIDQDLCYDYFVFDYNPDKINRYFDEHKWTTEDIQYEGLLKMFNDGWIKSPAYVDWKEGLYFAIEPRIIENLLMNIYDPTMRVQILQFIVGNAEYILDKKDIEQIPFYEYLLSVHSIDAQFFNQDKEYKDYLQSSKPKSGDNNNIRKYMEYKIKTNPDFKLFCNNHPLKEVCKLLEDELHIDINVDSFRRNINRHINPKKR